jgi:tetratricopeptide (TPR) repeat protein
MTRHPLRLAALSWSLLIASVPAALADLFHLKNGATIVADSWEERGDSILIRQGDRTLTIPRADVLRVETSSGTGAAGSSTGGASTGGTSAGGGKKGSGGRADGGRDIRVDLGDTGPEPSREEVERQIEDLTRRIRDYPLASAANKRQLVALLCRVGASAYRKRDYDEALQRFRDAQSTDPHDAVSALGLAATYVAQGQDIYARSTLERALLDHPSDAPLLTLLGDVYNSEERPEDALAAWEKAIAARPDAAIKERIEKLQREHAIDGAYRRTEAAHFTLKYDGERAGPDLDAQILDYLESEFPGLENRFDFVPRQPIVVILYPQKQFYDATLAESNVAGLFDGKIRAPLGGLQRLDVEARKVLLHELAHAFITGKSHGAAPRWLQEGLAQQIEGKTTPASIGRSLAGQYRNLEDRSSWGNAFSYPSALSLVEFLIDREGFPRLVDALQAMGEGQGVDEAFRTATRYSLQELRAAWGDSLVARYLQ